ncbi:unnamed protein product, partial [Prunus brigantina]
IFGIYLVKDKQNPTLDDVLGPGSNTVAAGNCMYGSSCTLVISTGHGVNGFTLDPALGEFLLTHSNIKILHFLALHSTSESSIYDDEAMTILKAMLYSADSTEGKNLLCKRRKRSNLG